MVRLAQLVEQWTGNSKTGRVYHLIINFRNAYGFRSDIFYKARCTHIEGAQ